MRDTNCIIWNKVYESKARIYTFPVYLDEYSYLLCVTRSLCSLGSGGQLSRPFRELSATDLVLGEQGSRFWNLRSVDWSQFVHALASKERKLSRRPRSSQSLCSSQVLVRSRSLDFARNLYCRLFLCLSGTHHSLSKIRYFSGLLRRPSSAKRHYPCG